MRFPFDRYIELPIERRNTLQVFITNACNLSCTGCFARNVMSNRQKYISVEEYKEAVQQCISKGGKQINILGGEPLLHPKLKTILEFNRKNNLKTTVYTNGNLLDKFTPEDFVGEKLRVSIYCVNGLKGVYNIPKVSIPFDANFMVSKGTTLEEMLEISDAAERIYNCAVFFISSIRELDNQRQEFFDDTENTMPVVKYKDLCHQFLHKYHGKMDIHISKRGVFESSVTIPDTKCRFANYFIGGGVIQCPYDVVNLKFQSDYSFGVRSCQQNNTCLMSKVIYRLK